MKNIACYCNFPPRIAMTKIQNLNNSRPADSQAPAAPSGPAPVRTPPSPSLAVQHLERRRSSTSCSRHRAIIYFQIIFETKFEETVVSFTTNSSAASHSSLTVLNFGIDVSLLVEEFEADSSSEHTYSWLSSLLRPKNDRSTF